MSILSRLQSLVFRKSDLPADSADITETGARAWKAAETTLQNHKWTGSIASSDAELYTAMPIMRARARELVQNNPYAERYLAELEANVISPQGMTLQMQVEEYNPDAEGKKDPRTGKPTKGAMQKDLVANDKIESAWWEWKQKGICDVSGELTFHDIERLMLREAATSGNAFCRMVPKWQGNDFRFALQPIESELLDTNYSDNLANGNRVVMGVEMDKWGKRVAYHFLTNHPGGFLSGRIQTAEYRERIDAKYIIHLFMRKRMGQTIGATWFAPVMDLMEMLRGYEEAELISARSEACKGGFYYNEMGENVGPPTKPDGIRKKMVPGQMEILPAGWKFQPNNPTHPNGNYVGYRGGVIRGIASGLGVSYNILANDLVGVSYSSLRGGLLDEREIYMMIQEWNIAHFHVPVFLAWLESALMTDKINLPTYKEEKFRKPYFQGRRWDWVDPKKDIEASILAVKHGFASTQEIVASRGKYIKDIAREQEEDNALQELHGLDWSSEGAPDQTPEETGDVEIDEDAIAEAAADAGATVADTALNGIQVQALLDVLQKVGTGELPKSSAIAIIHAAFPLMDEDTIDAMLKDIEEGGQEPTPPPALPNPPKPVTTPKA